MASDCRALVRTMPAVYAIIGPTKVNIEPKDIRFAPEFATLWSIAPKGRYAAHVNGQWVSRTQWSVPLRAGDICAFVHVTHGGGDSNPLQVLLSIAIIAVSVYTGNYVGVQLGYGQLAGSIAAAGIALAGSLVANAIFAPDTGPSGGAATMPSPTYSFAAQGNQARLNGSIPVGYGHELVFPDFGSQPYIEYDDDDNQYFCAALIRGIGHYEFLQVYIDDTPIENFKGVTCVRVGPGQVSRAGSFTAYETFADVTDIVDTRMVSSLEIGGQDLLDVSWHGNFTVNNAGTTVNAIYIDVLFPRGLGTVEGDGSISSRDVTIEVAVRVIDDYGKANGEWTSLGSTTISASTSSQVRRSLVFTSLPSSPARYQARIRRTVEKSDNGRHLNDLQWAGLRSLLAVDSGIARTDVTGLGLRIQANEQLSGLSQRRIAVLARRLIPVYDTGTETWSDPVATRNPAHAFADLLHDSTYGRGLPDSRIDHETLADLAALYETRQDRFDYTFDTRITVEDALRVIARAGRATPVFRRGAVYSMVRDSAQPGPVAAFMPRNMEQDSFVATYAMPTEETVDAVRITYRSNITWSDKTIIAQMYSGDLYAYLEETPPQGVPDPENIVDVRLLGVCGMNHAMREAAYIMADGYYRRTRLSWNTELEGMVPSFGSLVSLAHDVSAWAQSGDILSFNSTSGYLVPADPVTWTDGQQHYLRIQDRDGSVSEAIAVQRPADNQDAIQLLTGFSGTVVTDDPTTERTRFLFGALSDVMRQARITGIVPQSERSISINAVIEDDRVHTADETFLPGSSEEQDRPPDGGTVVIPDDGSNAVVNLNGRTWIDVAFNYNPPEFYPGITLRFYNNGVFEIQTINPDWRWFHTTAQDLIPADGRPATTFPGEWMSQTITPETASLYEVWVSELPELRMDCPTPFTADPLDTWLSLGTTREFGWKSSGPVYGEGISYQNEVMVWIRRVVDQTILAQCQFTLGLQFARDPGFSDT